MTYLLSSKKNCAWCQIILLMLKTSNLSIRPKHFLDVFSFFYFHAINQVMLRVALNHPSIKADLHQDLASSFSPHSHICLSCYLPCYSFSSLSLYLLIYVYLSLHRNNIISYKHTKRKKCWCNLVQTYIFRVFIIKNYIIVGDDWIEQIER